MHFLVLFPEWQWLSRAEGTLWYVACLCSKEQAVLTVTLELPLSQVKKLQFFTTRLSVGVEIVLIPPGKKLRFRKSMAKPNRGYCNRREVWIQTLEEWSLHNWNHIKVFRYFFFLQLFDTLTESKSEEAIQVFKLGNERKILGYIIVKDKLVAYV